MSESLPPLSTELPDEPVSVAALCNRPSCSRPVPPQDRRHGSERRYCSPGCRRAHWEEQHPRLGTPRQAALDFSRPLPPVLDQRVPKAQRVRLQRMSRLILERLRQGPATASELAGMFPGARSVRTRISDVGRWLAANGERLCSEPAYGPVGEWIYRIEPERG